MTANITRPTTQPPAPAVDRRQPPATPISIRTDPRVQALLRFAISITVFTALGYLFFGFEQAPITPIVCLPVSYATALALECVDCWAQRRRPEFAGSWKHLFVFLLPPHITAMSCAILLYGNASLWPYVFAVVVAHASKYVFRLRVNGRLRHILNPSNTGIAVTLLLFSWVGIAPPYDFTNWLHGTLAWLIPIGILGAGTMLNAGLTKKLPLIAGWVGGFVLQAVLRSVFLHFALLGALLPMTGVAFVLYTNYMITDPGSTPTKPRSQAVFGLTNALVYGIMVAFGIVFGLFFALVITCLLRGAVLLLARLRVRLRADRARHAAGVPVPRGGAR